MDLIDMKKSKKTSRSKPVRTAVPAMGVGWYQPDDWARVRETAADAEKLENSFAEWEAMANDSMPLVRLRFPNAVKVFIVADEFLMWCQLRGKVNNSEARAEFVSEKLLAERDVASTRG